MFWWEGTQSIWLGAIAFRVVCLCFWLGFLVPVCAVFAGSHGVRQSILASLVLGSRDLFEVNLVQLLLSSWMINPVLVMCDRMPSPSLFCTFRVQGFVVCHSHSLW